MPLRKRAACLQTARQARLPCFGHLFSMIFPCRFQWAALLTSLSSRRLCKRCVFWQRLASALETFCLRWGAVPLRDGVFLPIKSCCSSLRPSECYKQLRPCFRLVCASMPGISWKMSRRGCRITHLWAGASDWIDKV